MASSKASGTADVTVASIQSISQTHRLQKFDANKVKLILIDEAHHAAAKSYLKVLAYFGADKANCEPVVIGVSATLSRMDGLSLGSAMDCIVYHR